MHRSLSSGIRRNKTYQDVLEDRLHKIAPSSPTLHRKKSTVDDDFSELNDIVNLLSQKTKSLEKMLDVMSEKSKKVRDAIKIINNEEVIPF